MKVNIKNAALAVLLSLGVVSGANAAVYRWSFSDATQTDFAFLDFDTVTSDFRLFDNSANNYLTGNLGVNGISFDFNGAQTLNATAVTSLNGSGAVNYGNTTIGTLSATTNPLLITGYTSGFVTASNGSESEIGDGEGTMFNFGTIAYSNIDNVAIRFNTNNGALNSGGAGWVGGTLVQTTPVPEAETGAMMALGLGLIGFVARRRKKA